MQGPGAGERPADSGMAGTAAAAVAAARPAVRLAAVRAAEPGPGVVAVAVAGRSDPDMEA